MESNYPMRFERVVETLLTKSPNQYHVYYAGIYATGSIIEAAAILYSICIIERDTNKHFYNSIQMDSIDSFIRTLLIPENLDKYTIIRDCIDFFEPLLNQIIPGNLHVETSKQPPRQ